MLKQLPLITFLILFNSTYGINKVNAGILTNNLIYSEYFSTSNSYKSNLKFIHPELIMQEDSINKPDSKDVTKNIGFIKKLFAGATKEEKIAKKEASILKKLNEQQIRIYGWYPYSYKHINSFANFNSITTVSFYSVDAYFDSNKKRVSFRDNGIYGDAAKDLFKRAYMAGSRSDLTFKCDDPGVIDSVLNNKNVRDSCIRYLTHMLDSTELRTDGICVFFENLPENNSGSLVLFLAELKHALKKSNRSIKLVLPANDSSKNYDVLNLNKIVDEYILIGYNFYHVDSKGTSVLPRDDINERFGYKRSVKEYINKGISINKLIVALPNFAFELDKQNKSNVEDLQKHTSIAEIMRHLFQTPSTLKIDSTNSCKYFDYENNGGNVRCYFDSEKTLEKKYKWLMGQGIAGIGIWLFNQNDLDKDFWKMISENYVVAKLNPINKELSIKKRIITDTTIAFSFWKDSLVKRSIIITDTLIKDTLFNRLLLVESNSNDSIPPVPPIKQLINLFNTTFEPVTGSSLVILVVVITLVIFGFLGILASLLFASVRELVYVRNIPTYIFINIGLILTAIGLFSFINLLKSDIECSPINYDFLKKVIWYILISAWIIINLLSHKLIGAFSFNNEKP